MVTRIRMNGPREDQIQAWPHQLPMKPAVMPAASSISRETLATMVTPLDRSSRTRTRSTSRCLRSAKVTAAAGAAAGRQAKTPQEWAEEKHRYKKIPRDGKETRTLRAR